MKKNLVGVNAGSHIGILSANKKEINQYNKSPKLFLTTLAFTCVFLLLLVFSANNNVMANDDRAECPPGWEDWNPYTHLNHYKQVIYGECIFEYFICRRPAQPPSLLRYEYYISEIRLLTHKCDMTYTDIIANYKHIFDLCVSHFAWFLYWGSVQDLAINCDNWVYPNNIIIVGHPSLLSKI